MLTITIPAMEIFDEATSEFRELPEISLDLEHSLVSLSKWEQEYKKAFLTKEPKTDDEALGYVRAMTLTPNVPSEVYSRLTNGNITEINAYIEDKPTATWFADANGPRRPSRDVLTAEVFYYLIFSNQIDRAVENWHLHKLITLIEVFAKKNAPPSNKKMSPRELAARNKQLNEQRLAASGGKG